MNSWRKRGAGLATVVAAAMAMSSIGVVPSSAAPAHRGARSTAAASSVLPASDHLKPALAPLFAGTRHVQTRVAPRSIQGRSTPAHSTFAVTYHGFPANAHAAFAHAVTLWSKLVSSTETIRIDATWTPLGGNILGQAGPGDMLQNFPGAPIANTWYPEALANSLAHKKLSSEPDIVAEFNSSFPDWYLGTDGNPPVNLDDLSSVVLHELGHGLGFIGSMEYSGGEGSWGEGTGSPFAFDRYTENVGAKKLLSVPNDSAALGAQLVSNALYLDGSHSVSGNGGHRPKLYAPPTWEDGSSYSHLDEDTYPAGNVNSLMTPILDWGESVQDPGDAALGLFADMGWKTASPISAPGAMAFTSAYSGPSLVKLAWTRPTDTGRRVLTGYQLKRYTGGSSSADETTTLSPSATAATLSDVVDGTSYRYTIAAVNGTGTGPATAKTASLVPFDPGPFADAQALVYQQYQDLLGRAPTPSEMASGRVSLSSGATSPSPFIVGLMNADKGIPPIVRLYQAYFQRLPDIGGLRYWAGKLRAGSSVAAASNSFVVSAEFKATYGSLSNSGFVQLVYHNVLGRAPDSAGLSYWTKQLSKGESRGSVMIGFSESAELVNVMAPTVETIQIYYGMLRRMPTDGELSTAVAQLTGGTSFSALVSSTFRGDEYRARFGYSPLP